MRDTKILLRILILYLPLPLFWALYDQQGSRWIFQAAKMDGDIGIYTIKPDQTHILNPLLVVLLVPFIDAFVYPVLRKVGITSPLRKLALGGVLAAFAFVCSGFLELELEKMEAVLPDEQHGQVRIFNGLPCEYAVESNIRDYEHFTLKPLEAFQLQQLHIFASKRFDLKLQRIESENETAGCPQNLSRYIEAYPNIASSLFISGDNKLSEHFFVDNPRQSRTGSPLVRFLVSSKEPQQFSIRNKKRPNELLVNSNTENKQQFEALSEPYEIFIGERLVGTFALKQGSVSTIIIHEVDNSTFYWNTIEIAAANSMSMLWLIPQYAVLAVGETIFAVTGIQFSYSEAPQSMKSVVQACWLLTIAMGNLMLMIVVEIKIFESQANEFFLFAILMVLDMCIFMLLAKNYKRVDVENDCFEQVPLKSIE